MGRDLIASLEEECRLDRSAVEDFLNALTDIVVDRLRRGESVTIGRLCRLTLRDGGKQRAVKFQASAHTTEALALREKYDSDLCRACGARRRAPMRMKCYSCIGKERRRKIHGAANAARR